MFRKKILVILITMLIIFTQSSALSYAYRNTEESNGIGFNDIKKGHWAYDAVKWMVESGSLSGYPDKTFKPEKTITRAEFSKIMVLALNLPIKKPSEGTFNDLDKDHWAYSFVESAKYYLTGFRDKNGTDRFWADREAVREDMAVALVRAKNYENEEADESLLDVFADKDSISPNIRKYVAIAVKHEIMKGSPIENSEKKAFRPAGFLTRAEASALIYNVLQVSTEEEKVVYDQGENSVDDSQSYVNETDSIYDYPSVQVQGQIKDGKINLNWNKAVDRNFSYYKVVISKSNPLPRYPQDGYLYVIDNREQTSVIIKDGGYNGGDFGSKLIPGQKYYFSVTSVYGDVKVPGNAVSLVYPEEIKSTASAPVLSGRIENGKIILNWDLADKEGFVYYKIVISQYNSKPKYPDDGYLSYISDRNTTTTVVDNKKAYINGDFGKYLVPGQKYYFSITVVYDGKKVATNTLEMVYPGSTVENQKRTAPVVKGSVQGNGISLNWSKASSSGFVYYKVVISKDDSTPVYPEDGYLYVISDINNTSAVVNNRTPYNGGTFGEYLIPGQKYYFSITAVYDDEKLAGNALRLTYP